MILRLDRKVPGGKLVRLRVEFEEGGESIVREVSVSGDFFAHPEEIFEAAERSLSGLGVTKLVDAARSAFARPDLRIFGASPDDIADALEELLGRLRGGL